MIVTVVTIIALAAVGIAALVTNGLSSSSPSIRTTKASAVPTNMEPRVTVAPTTAIPVTTSTPAGLTNFLGTWSMHDGGLIITASGAGTVSVPGTMYAGCSQMAQIQVSPESATSALATITAIEAPGCPGVPTTFNPSGGGGTDENLSAGFTFTITIATPGVQTSLGINYCDQAHAAQSVCAA
jgi:hypothetical protein